MPYIGNNLATQFQAFATQTITGDGSTSYTLDRAVANGKALLVYINNVKQEEGSGKSYEASGTTITFSEAVASGDSCYLVYLGSAVQTINPPDNSVGITQLAVSDGSNGQVLSTNGSGTLSFSTVDTSGATDSFTISGSTPTLTIGDAGAEDTKIVFDGNAQDFHIGLDDSEDKLTIGLGSTLGTTSHMTFDSTGAILKPLQPAFLARPASAQTNVAASGSDVVVVFGTEVFDQNADFASNTFTAPVTGRYLFNVNLYLSQIPHESTWFTGRLVTSNFTYSSIDEPQAGGDNSYHSIQFSVVTDMDASDTAYVNFYQAAGSNQIDINVYSYFSGCLIA